MLNTHHCISITPLPLMVNHGKDGHQPEHHKGCHSSFPPHRSQARSHPLGPGACIFPVLVITSPKP